MSLRLIIIIIVIIIIVIIGAIYLFGIKSPGVLSTTAPGSINYGSVTTPTTPSNQNSSPQSNLNPDADKITNISNDLKKIQDDSSLNNYMISFDKILQNF